MTTLDHGHYPPFVRIGDRICPSASLVSVLLYRFTDDLYGISCAAGVLGYVHPHVVENASVRNVLPVFPGVATVRSDGHSPLVHSGIGDTHSRELAPDELPVDFIFFVSVFVCISVGDRGRNLQPTICHSRLASCRNDVNVEHLLSGIILVVAEQNAPVNGCAFARDNRKAILPSQIHPLPVVGHHLLSITLPECSPCHQNHTRNHR